MYQVTWAQCDGFEHDFAKAVEKSLKPNFSTAKNPVSVVVGEVLSVGRRTPNSPLSDMTMRVDSVLHGPYQGKTLSLTAAGRAEFVRFDYVIPGERYEVVFIATEEGNVVPYCGTYFKRLDH